MKDEEGAADERESEMKVVWSEGEKVVSMYKDKGKYLNSFLFLLSCVYTCLYDNRL
jgi:hypothetical protein